MSIFGHIQAQRAQQDDLSRRIGQVVLAAEHMGDSHQGIIQRVTEKESRCTVRATDNKIADIRQLEFLRPFRQVVKINDTLIGDSIAQGWSLAVEQAFVDFFFIELAAR